MDTAYSQFKQITDSMENHFFEIVYTTEMEYLRVMQGYMDPFKAMINLKEQLINPIWGMMRAMRGIYDKETTLVSSK